MPPSAFRAQYLVKTSNRAGRISPLACHSKSYKDEINLVSHERAKSISNAIVSIMTVRHTILYFCYSNMKKLKDAFYYFLPEVK